MHAFRKLKVWQRAMDFVAEIYKLSAGFPRTEQFGLTSQIRRAATSIPLNVAEGAGSGSNPEFQRFLSYALRSSYEVMTAWRLHNASATAPQIQHRLSYPKLTKSQQ